MTLDSTAFSIPSRSQHTQEAIEAITLNLSANQAEGANDETISCRAVLVLENGSQVRCEITDLSPQGAYLLRNSMSSKSPRVDTGDHLKAFIFLPGNTQMDGVTVSATIIRVEEGAGRGLAIRFEHEKDEATSRHTAAAAAEANLPWDLDLTEELDWTDEEATTSIQERIDAVTSATQRAVTVSPIGARFLRHTLWVAIVGINVAAFLVLTHWLSAVL